MLPQPALRVAVHPGSILQMARVAGQTLATERNALIQALKLLGAVIPYSRNSEIFGEDEPVEYVYRVESGSVRTYKIFTDGRRQIVRFYLPGDIFGIELADQHTLSAEAIVDAKILAVKRSALTALAGRDPTISVELIALTGRELQRVRDRVLLLAKTAQERVAGFLLEMATGATGDVVKLPMSRRDIADYLGLTLETVSRTFLSLKGAAAIEMPTARCIVLCNRALLNKCA